MQNAKWLLFYLFFSLFMLCFMPLQAQSKSHFRVLENGIEVQNTICHAAMADLDMDFYRYTDVRRQIGVDGTNFIIELFSGQELWASYQKQISPNNRPVAQDAYPNLHFILTGNRLKIQTQ